MNTGKSQRRASTERETTETTIAVELNLDGTGTAEIGTGVGFLDHMLHLLARHGRFDIDVRATGDLEVDDHHTTEDVGIVLGDAFAEAVGEKAGIHRFASVCLPMQESLARVVVDVSGRAFLVFNADFPTDKVGDFDVELVEEFLQAFVNHAGLTLHVDLLRGSNSHHAAEAIFKGLARVLRRALGWDAEARGEVPSTKGKL